MNIRSILSAVKVVIGLNPKLCGKPSESRKCIPDSYKSVCLISADFEMAWAFVHSKQTKKDRDRAVRLGLQTRSNLPKILDLCDKYNIPLTWATVGHLFLDSCSHDNGEKHANLPRIPYFENEFWEYQAGDWFDSDPCTDCKTNPAYYASDLIDRIAVSKARHEIGCHTFSHIDCSDTNCPTPVLEAEIRECQALAENRNIILKSFVHPGHQIGHLEDLHRLGFASYRTNNGDVLGNPVKHKSGLWEFQNTAELVYRAGWPDKLNMYKYRRIINRAIRHHKLLVFWFHPSFDDKSLEKVFLPVLKLLDAKRKDIWITTHAEYASYLNAQE